MNYVSSFKKYLSSQYERVNSSYKKVVSLFLLMVFSHPQIIEYRNKMDKKLWPSPKDGDALIVEHDALETKSMFPISGFDPCGKQAFGILHHMAEKKWEEDNVSPRGTEIYMGRLSIENKIHYVWWCDEEEAYWAQECN